MLQLVISWLLETNSIWGDVKTVQDKPWCDERQGILEAKNAQTIKYFLKIIIYRLTIGNTICSKKIWIFILIVEKLTHVF